MVEDLLTVFCGCFLLPLPFIWVVYLVRQLKNYFTDASGIDIKD